MWIPNTQSLGFEYNLIYTTKYMLAKIHYQTVYNEMVFSNVYVW